MSSSPPTNAAVWGMGCSGVVVASAMTSMSRGESRAFSRATRAAFVASVAVDSWSAAMRRSRIPVFSRIHPSSTPKCCSSSALSMTVVGTSDPHPAKRNGVMRFSMVFLYGSCSRAAEERLLHLHGPLDGFIDGCRDRYQIEGLAPGLEVRSKMLAHVLGPAGRAVPLERLVRQPVEPLHRLRQPCAGGFDVRVEAAPDFHGVLPTDGAAAGAVGMLGDERDRFGESARRAERSDPAVTERSGPSHRGVGTTADDQGDRRMWHRQDARVLQLEELAVEADRFSG